MTHNVTISPGDMVARFGLHALGDKEISITSKRQLEESEVTGVLQDVSDLRHCQEEIKQASRDIDLRVFSHAPTEWKDKKEYIDLLNACQRAFQLQTKFEETKKKLGITEYKESFTQKRIIVGIAGGTGSGKTALADELMRIFRNHAVLIEQDAYYKDLSHLPKVERANQNFDHPDSLDFDQLEKDLLALREGETITKPQYDFKEHARKPAGLTVKPNQIIIVEGILLFAVEPIRKLFDLKVFVDTDADERIVRRIDRDTKERGRTIESVKQQYLTTVKPMHDQFVKPSRDYATMIAQGSGKASTIEETALLVADMIESKLSRMQTDLVNGKRKASSPPSSPLRHQ